MAKNNSKLAFSAVNLVLVLLALTTAVAEADTCTGKRLVVLAGPRRSATTSVAEFFYKYARGTQPNHKNGKTYHPLHKFRWPLVYGDASNKTEVDMPYKRFNHLVTDPDNKPLRKEIIDAIKRDWELDEVQAVIFGGEEFDQVGESAPNGYDVPIQAVKDVADAIGASPECVDIVINYRVPRFEHWVSLYSSLTASDEDPPTFRPYEEHMCEDKSSTNRVEELGTSMNPMYLAETYLNVEGYEWNVKMIDMGGVESFGTDISHTIGCDILNGICDDEGKWVKGHIEEAIMNKQLQRDFNSLPQEEVANAEKLFAYRDCAYEDDLRNNERFQVVQNRTIWAECTHDDDINRIYQSFRDTKIGPHLVFDALLSQVDCKPYGGAPEFGQKSHAEEIEEAKIEDFLSGTYQDKHNIFKIIEGQIIDIENGHFSTPLVMVLMMFAAGIGFYVKKVRDNPEYELPSDFEMPDMEGIRGKVGEFSESVAPMVGQLSDNIAKSQVGQKVSQFSDNVGLSDKIGRFQDNYLGGQKSKARDSDDESSSSSESDDSDSDEEVDFEDEPEKHEMSDFI